MSDLILVTGFSIFPGAPENPTQWLVDELNAGRWQPHGARVVAHTLDVRFDVWSRQYAPMLNEVRPQAVIAFGLSAKARGITLESTGQNRVGLARADFTGAFAESAIIDALGPVALPTRLPLVPIARQLDEAGIPFAHSDDAGDYMCNLVKYRLLQTDIPIVGFIHVPYLTSQLARLTPQQLSDIGASLTEHQLMDAAKLIIQCIADELPARRSVLHV